MRETKTQEDNMKINTVVHPTYAAQITAEAFNQQVMKQIEYFSEDDALPLGYIAHLTKSVLTRDEEGGVTFNYVGI